MSRRVKFTAANVKTLPGVPGAQVDYSDLDDGGRGLRLRISASGTRAYMAAYSVRGKSRKVALGPVGGRAMVPDGKGGRRVVRLTLPTARRLVQDIKAQARHGVDPLEERRRKRKQEKADAITFGDYLTAFEKERLPAVRLATASNWRSIIKRDLRPRFGHLRPQDVDAEALAEMVADITNGTPGPKEKGEKTWKRKPAPVSGRRAFETARVIFGWVDRDLYS
jgi:hypothetical protein